MPTAGASVSSRSAPALMRSLIAAVDRKSSGSTRVPSRSSRPRRTSSPESAPRLEAPDNTTRAKRRAGQAVFVIHRCLVHEIGKIALAFELTGAEKDQVRSAHDCQRRVILRHVDDQPVAAGRLPARCQCGVDQVQRREVDDTSRSSRISRHPLVALDDVAAPQRNEKFSPAVGERPPPGPTRFAPLRA